MCSLDFTTMKRRDFIKTTALTVPVISLLPAATVTHFEAQAKFLRAWFNFEAWLVFKNIVIIKEDTPAWLLKIFNNYIFVCNFFLYLSGSFR